MLNVKSKKFNYWHYIILPAIIMPCLSVVICTSVVPYLPKDLTPNNSLIVIGPDDINLIKGKNSHSGYIDLKKLIPSHSGNTHSVIINNGSFVYYHNHDNLLYILDKNSGIKSVKLNTLINSTDFTQVDYVKLNKLDDKIAIHIFKSSQKDSESIYTIGFNPKTLEKFELPEIAKLSHDLRVHKDSYVVQLSHHSISKYIFKNGQIEFVADWKFSGFIESWDYDFENQVLVIKSGAYIHVFDSIKHIKFKSNTLMFTSLCVDEANKIIYVSMRGDPIRKYSPYYAYNYQGELLGKVKSHEFPFVQLSVDREPEKTEALFKRYGKLVKD